MEEKIKEFEKVRKEVGGVIKVFPEVSRDKILFDRWSLKDIVEHLSNWMVHDIECLDSLESGVEPHWEPSFDEFNKRGVEERSVWTWEEVVEEYEKLNKDLIETYKSLRQDLWNKPIWKGYGLTARKFFQNDIEHQREHLKDLENKLRKYLLSDTVTQ